MAAEPAFGAESLDDADQHLLMELTGDLASPEEPSEARKRTAIRLGQHLHLARAMFATFSPTKGFAIDCEFHNRVPRLPEPHGLDILTTDAISQLWAGQLVANDDLDRTTTPALYPPAILATQTRSIVIVPLRYRRQLVAVFVMTRTHPHAWTRRELALASILAEHTWFASEHQRAVVALAEVEARNRQLLMETNESYWERVMTEAKLRALTDTLEEKVVSRTQELENAHAAVTRSEANFRALITSAPYAVIVVQLDDRIAYANPAAVSMLCYEDASRLVGTSYATVVHPEDRAKVEERIRRERDKLPNPREELRWCGKDGVEIWVEVSSLATEYDGKPASFAMARDVTARRKAERALVASLHDKEILLREIHHRVKNNLQVVSSILAMQARLVSDEGARAQLDESQARVRSIGLVHEHLYRSEDSTISIFGTTSILSWTASLKTSTEPSVRSK